VLPDDFWSNIQRWSEQGMFSEVKEFEIPRINFEYVTNYNLNKLINIGFFNHLPKLETLFLQNNKYLALKSGAAELNKFLGKLTNLRFLDLEGNALGTIGLLDITPTLLKLKKLEVVALTGNWEDENEDADEAYLVEELEQRNPLLTAAKKPFNKDLVDKIARYIADEHFKHICFSYTSGITS